MEQESLDNRIQNNQNNQNNEKNQEIQEQEVITDIKTIRRNLQKELDVVRSRISELEELLANERLAMYDIMFTLQHRLKSE